MAFVQVNNVPQTLKMAAFIVAFFSSFFSFSEEAGVVDLKSPNTKIKFCASGTFSSLYARRCSDSYPEAYDSVCSAISSAYHLDTVGSSPSNVTTYSGFNCSKEGSRYYVYGHKTINTYENDGTPEGTFELDFKAGEINMKNEGEEVSKSCPPEDYPTYTISNNSTGELMCHQPLVNDDKDKNEKCQSFVLDSGNNSASDMCYTSPSSGDSCNVQKVTTDGGGSYYKGVSASLGGCFTSDNPEYDDSGTGDAKDDCLYSNGVNYCEANRAKHCKSTLGTEICDDGCIDDGTNLFCDTSRHPDVGEGDSNYFDDNGTCSVIAASSSRGFCEDSGGDWDETTDYQETSCPAGAGTCSVAVAGLCGSCFDAGGTWTPDPTSPLSNEAKVGIENQALAKTGNDKLTQIEHGQRKTSEATQSTIKSGNAKVVSAIESLGEKLSKPSEKEKESFTTTTSTTDKSKINSLFDATATATLTADIETLKTDITTSINSIRAEASSMMSITVPSATGYETRNLTLTQGTFDMSLNRFSDFFKALAMPVMLLCSILAGFILLGGKN